MPVRKQIEPGEQISLKRTATERKLVPDDVTCLDTCYEQIIRSTLSSRHSMMILDELDDWEGV
ncbi:MAG: hypothetical protein R3C59_20400 [Planctomycetaceae bacterium]